MPTPKIYLPMSAKEHEFKDGGTVLKLSAKKEKLIAFINQHTNAKGYVNMIVSRRREVGQYGDTHCVYLDTWEPKPKAEQAAPAASNDDGNLPF